MIAKSNGQGHDSYCLKCAGDLTLMSVVDDTIEPSTTKKEETNMDTLTETPAPQTMTLTWIENESEVTRTYSENDIVIGCENVPEINYIGDNNIKRKHFADIYIPAEKLMIEVKSTWTLLKSNVIIKMLAAQNEGFTYHFWIYNYKGEKVTCENLEETEAFVKILTNKFINNASESSNNNNSNNNENQVGDKEAVNEPVNIIVS